MVETFKAKGLASTALAPNVSMQHAKGGQDEWNIVNNKKGKNNGNKDPQYNQDSVSYA